MDMFASSMLIFLDRFPVLQIGLFVFSILCSVIRVFVSTNLKKQINNSQRLIFLQNLNLPKQGERFGVSICTINLCFILIYRWITSSHYPLSNLYEALLFLSFTLSFIVLLFGIYPQKQKGKYQRFLTQIKKTNLFSLRAHLNLSDLDHQLQQIYIQSRLPIYCSTIGVETNKVLFLHQNFQSLFCMEVIQPSLYETNFVCQSNFQAHNNQGLQLHLPRNISGLSKSPVNLLQIEKMLRYKQYLGTKEIFTSVPNSGSFIQTVSFIQHKQNRFQSFTPMIGVRDNLSNFEIKHLGVKYLRFLTQKTSLIWQNLTTKQVNNQRVFTPYVTYQKWIWQIYLELLHPIFQLAHTKQIYTDCSKLYQKSISLTDWKLTIEQLFTGEKSNCIKDITNCIHMESSQSFNTSARVYDSHEINAIKALCNSGWSSNFSIVNAYEICFTTLPKISIDKLNLTLERLNPNRPSLGINFPTLGWNPNDFCFLRDRLTYLNTEDEFFNSQTPGFLYDHQTHVSKDLEVVFDTTILSHKLSLRRPPDIFVTKRNFILPNINSENEIFSFSNIGILLLPIACIIYGFAEWILPKELQKATALVPALQSKWLAMHVSVILLSYTILIIGSIFAMSFLVLSSSVVIKRMPKSIHKKTTNFLDKISYRFLGLGFPFLTLGILSGSIWANQAWGRYWNWDIKEIWALNTWLVFAIYLHSRLNLGWQGRKPALVAVFGFFILWICFLGVNLVGQGLHSYGWFSS